MLELQRHVQRVNTGNGCSMRQLRQLSTPFKQPQNPQGSRPPGCPESGIHPHTIMYQLSAALLRSHRLRYGPAQSDPFSVLPSSRSKVRGGQMERVWDGLRTHVGLRPMGAPWACC
jgi:hypothetical protein